MSKNKEFENRISVAEMSKFIKENPPVNKIVTIGEMKVEVKPFIDVVELGRIVEEVCNAAFGEDGEYLPYVEDYMTKALIIETYTNIAMPQDMKKRFDLVDYLCSDSFSGGAFRAPFDEISEAIGDQYWILNHAISERIAFENNRHMRELSDAILNISNRVRSVGLTIENLIDEIMKYAPENAEENSDNQEEPESNPQEIVKAVKRIVAEHTGNEEAGDA